jgi:hypothetical protein
MANSFNIHVKCPTKFTWYLASFESKVDQNIKNIGFADKEFLDCFQLINVADEMDTP